VVQRRAKRSVDQKELDFTRPLAAGKPTCTPADVEKAARLAIARRGQPAGRGGKVRLTLTIFPSRKKAERLTVRAIREENNLEALVAEILEDAPE
jgi:hypothetical protein